MIPQGLGSLSLAACLKCWCWSGERKWGTRPRTKGRLSHKGQMQGDLMGNFMANESTRSIAMVFTYNQFGWEDARIRKANLKLENSAAKWYQAALSPETRKRSTACPWHVYWFFHKHDMKQGEVMMWKNDCSVILESGSSRNYWNLPVHSPIQYMCKIH